MKKIVIITPHEFMPSQNQNNDPTQKVKPLTTGTWAFGSNSVESASEDKEMSSATHQYC